MSDAPYQGAKAAGGQKRREEHIVKQVQHVFGVPN